MAKLTFIFLVRNFNLTIKESAKIYFILLEKNQQIPRLIRVSEKVLIISGSALITHAAAHTRQACTL